jgi:RNA polymerase sigma-70 factor (ECF subfamily)
MLYLSGAFPMERATASEGVLASTPSHPVAAVRSHRQEFRLSDANTLDNKGVQGIESAARIVALARAGDPEAFRAIFQRYGKPILAFIYHLLGDRSHAEELTQETFVRAYRGLDRMQNDVRLSTWLFGIARNVVRESIRSKQRGYREIGLDDLGSLAVKDERAGPDESFMTEELQRAIRRSFDELSDDQRVVFVCKMLNKMRYHEISVITGSSIGKLKTDLHRARQQMRESLRPYLAGRVPGIRGGL